MESHTIIYPTYSQFKQKFIPSSKTLKADWLLVTYGSVANISECQQFINLVIVSEYKCIMPNNFKQLKWHTLIKVTVGIWVPYCSNKDQIQTRTHIFTIKAWHDKMSIQMGRQTAWFLFNCLFQVIPHIPSKKLF